MTNSLIKAPIISADSHVTEPPNTFAGRLPAKFRDREPKMVQRPEGGSVFHVPGMETLYPITLAAGAGMRGQKLVDQAFAQFEDCHEGGWNPKARLRDQDTDGVGAEVLYPSLGMFLCNHEDTDYKSALFNAYNEWIAEYCETAPDRLIGLGQTAMKSPQDGIADLHAIKALGLRGVLMPGNPIVEDYDSPLYDPFWQAAVDLDLPLSFHILTFRGNTTSDAPRGPKANMFMRLIRSNQDIIGMLIFSGVFERFPDLKVVCAEADAGWAPHYMYRMDHILDRNPHWFAPGTISRKPSAYFNENIYLTYQDDVTAFKLRDMININRMMWASDFPHLDSTWPESQGLLKDQTSGMTTQDLTKILHDNAASLYKIQLQ